MKCYDVDTKLMDYLYGELGKPEQGILLSHLKECLPCSRKVNELKTSQKLLKVLPDEEVPVHLRQEFWKKPTREPLFAVWSWRVASVAAGFVLGVFSFYVVRFHVLPQAFESKVETAYDMAAPAKSGIVAPIAKIEKIEKPKESILTAEVSYPEKTQEEYVPRQSVSRDQIENDNVKSVSLGVTGGTHSAFGPIASGVESHVQETQNIPVSSSIRTRWFATKPFMMKEGQQAVLPSRQAKILLKDILYSPCTEYVTKCSWSGVGALYEFYNEATSQSQTVFMKKTNQGYPIQMKLNDTYLLEVWEITPTAVRTVIKTSQ